MRQVGAERQTGRVNGAVTAVWRLSGSMSAEELDFRLMFEEDGGPAAGT